MCNVFGHRHVDVCEVVHGAGPTGTTIGIDIPCRKATQRSPPGADRYEGSMKAGHADLVSIWLILMWTESVGPGPKDSVCAPAFGLLNFDF